MNGIDPSVYKILDTTTDYIIDWYIKQSLSKNFKGERIVNYNGNLALVVNDSFIAINITNVDNAFTNNVIQAAVLSTHMIYAPDEPLNVTENSKINIGEPELIENYDMDLIFKYPEEFKNLFMDKIVSHIPELPKVDKIITIENYKDYYKPGRYPITLLDKTNKEEYDTILTKIVYDINTMERIYDTNKLYVNIMAETDSETFEFMLGNERLYELIKAYMVENTHICVMPNMVRSEIFKTLYANMHNCDNAYLITTDDILKVTIDTIIKLLVKYKLASKDTRKLYKSMKKENAQ